MANLSSPTPSPSPTPTAPLAAAAPAFHVGEVGIAYTAVALTATGGVAPYKYAVVSGALPGGLTVGADGTIAGTPTAAGDFAFTIKLADSGDSATSITGQISIAAHVAATLLPACTQYCNVELGCAGACGNFGALSGGVGPYSYSVAQGPLPAGTSLNGLSLAGTFGGLSGWLQFTVQVTDSLGAAATISPRFWMYDHLSLAGGKCSSGAPRLGRSCTVTLSYSGGTPGQQVTLARTGWTPGSCSVVAFNPCGEPAMSVTYQPGLVVVSLTYQANYPATFGTLSVQLTSTDRCGQAVACNSAAAITVSG